VLLQAADTAKSLPAGHRQPVSTERGSGDRHRHAGTKWRRVPSIGKKLPHLPVLEHDHTLAGANVLLHRACHCRNFAQLTLPLLAANSAKLRSLVLGSPSIKGFVGAKNSHRRAIEARQPILLVQHGATGREGGDIRGGGLGGTAETGRKGRYDRSSFCT